LGELLQPFDSLDRDRLFDPNLIEEYARVFSLQYGSSFDCRKPDADSFVFNSQKSTQLNRVTIYKLFKQIAKKASLGETLQHPHVLKHTTAMLMVQQGANAFMIRQHLGHRSFDSTLAYVNPSDADASAASAKAFSQVF
jgi:site-specific recombinase XerD